MALAPNKTKLVCTIGPASETPGVMRQMLDAGMNIARLNYAHGDLVKHQSVIADLRRAALVAGKLLTIMADLPGPKIRVGQVDGDLVALKKGAAFTLTTDEISGDAQRVSVNFPRLPAVVKPGDLLFLNDGIIQVEVVKVAGNDVMCRVVVGGGLGSHKGLNLPGVDLGVCAFTAHDHECLKSALENGVDAISQSFVETASDVNAVRNAAVELGFHPFIIAKIERAGALDHIDEILLASDGIMIARGDLGVEIPMERIAVVQKQLTSRANLMGKPVITATQMLESMVDHSRPTRAEATDVANAILDGTECVMLSEESAMGNYPTEAVGTLAKIATATEPFRIHGRMREVFADYDRVHEVPLEKLMSHNVQQTVDHLNPVAVIVSTATGNEARLIARFKMPVWVAAVSRDEATCQGLQFSYGVQPVHVMTLPEDWNSFARSWVRSHGLPDGLAVFAEGPTADHPNANHRLDVIDLSQG